MVSRDTIEEVGMEQGLKGFVGSRWVEVRWEKGRLKGGCGEESSQIGKVP